MWKVKVKVKLLSRVRLFPTPWTVAYQAPPSMGFSRQECWNAGMDCHFLLQGTLLDPGIKPGSLALQADALPSEPPGKPMDVEPTDNLLYMLSEAAHLVGQTGLYI